MTEGEMQSARLKALNDPIQPMTPIPTIHENDQPTPDILNVVIVALTS